MLHDVCVAGGLKNEVSHGPSSRVVSKEGGGKLVTRRVRVSTPRDDLFFYASQTVLTTWVASYPAKRCPNDMF